MARPAPLLTVGLTFFLHRERQSIWNNGAAQNCVFLWQLLRRSPLVGRVYAINGGDGEAASAALMLDGLGIEFVRMEEVVDKLDVLIQGSAQVYAHDVARVRARGGKAVAYKMGNEFVIDAERVIHGHPAGSIFNGSQFDEVWTTPQHVATCAAYWRTAYRCPVRVLPHIWEPLFVDKAAAELPAATPFGYRPGRKAKRVSVFEPNVNLVKTAIVPMLICEEAFRARPDLVGEVHVLNAVQLKGHLTFQKFAANLDICNAQAADGHAVCCFEARYPAPTWLAQHTDVVVAHQWENGLNYSYYDALHGGYPLVHNADLPGGIGYRYDGFDCQEGGRALVRAISEHDAHADAYAATCRTYLDTVRATSPVNIETHTTALAALWGD